MQILTKKIESRFYAQKKKNYRAEDHLWFPRTIGGGGLGGGGGVCDKKKTTCNRTFWGWTGIEASVQTGAA